MVENGEFMVDFVVLRACNELVGNNKLTDGNNQLMNH